MNLPINKIICGDCPEIMKRIPDESVDLIFVDPPYGKDGIYLYEVIAKESARILKQGKFAVFYASNYWFDLCFPKLNNYLKFFYLFHSIFTHQSGQNYPRRIFIAAKIISVFSKGDAKPLNWVSNVIPKTKPEKRCREDKWQQPVQDAYFFIKNFYKPNDIVLDPNVGSGTTCVAAEQLERRWIGIDIDKDQCKMARNRIAYERRNPGFRIFK